MNAEARTPSASLIALALEEAGLKPDGLDALKIATGLQKGAFAVENRLRNELADAMEKMGEGLVNEKMKATMDLVVEAIREYPLAGDPA